MPRIVSEINRCLKRRIKQWCLDNNTTEAAVTRLLWDAITLSQISKTPLVEALASFFKEGEGKT